MKVLAGSKVTSLNINRALAVKLNVAPSINTKPEVEPFRLNNVGLIDGIAVI